MFNDQEAAATPGGVRGRRNAMTCDAVRQLLLNLDLDAPARRRLAAALAHLEGCKQCTLAFHDFDRLAGLMSPGPRAHASDEPDEELGEDAGEATSEGGDTT